MTTVDTLNISDIGFGLQSPLSSAFRCMSVDAAGTFDSTEKLRRVRRFDVYSLTANPICNLFTSELHSRHSAAPDICIPLLSEWKKISDSITTNLLADREEAKLENEESATDASIVGCKKIARFLKSWLVNPPEGFRWAVFGGSNGESLLVIRSEETSRRIDFHVAASGLNVFAISINEDLRPSRLELDFNDIEDFRGQVKWVLSRP